MPIKDRASSRLPSYQSKYLRRYHPYPRISRPGDRHEDRVDCGTSDPLPDNDHDASNSNSPLLPPAIYLAPTRLGDDVPDADVPPFRLSEDEAPANERSSGAGCARARALKAALLFIMVSRLLTRQRQLAVHLLQRKLLHPTPMAA